MDKKSFATFYSLRLQNKTAQGTEFYFGIQLRKVFAFMQQLVWPAKRPPVMNAMCACVYARRRSHFDDIISYQIIAQVQVRKKKNWKFALYSDSTCRLQLTMFGDLFRMSPAHLRWIAGVLKLARNHANRIDVIFNSFISRRVASYTHIRTYLLEVTRKFCFCF